MKAKKSIYIQANVIFFNGNLFERLFNHPEGLKYRILYTSDDYDYVTSKSIISILNTMLTYAEQEELTEAIA